MIACTCVHMLKKESPNCTPIAPQLHQSKGLKNVHQDTVFCISVPLWVGHPLQTDLEPCRHTGTTMIYDHDASPRSWRHIVVVDITASFPARRCQGVTNLMGKWTDSPSYALPSSSAGLGTGPGCYQGSRFLMTSQTTANRRAECRVLGWEEDTMISISLASAF